MNRPTQTLSSAYSAGNCAGNPHSWGFTGSAYERDQSAAPRAALHRTRCPSTFEPACSIGNFTRALAERCDRLPATDRVPAAVEAARTRCADQPRVGIRRGAVPADWPEGRFDLIVLSEFLYSPASAEPAALVRRAGDAIEPGGDMVLAHWLGVTDDPQSGDAAAEGFIARAAPFAGLLHQSRTAEYRPDVLRAGPTA